MSLEVSTMSNLNKSNARLLDSGFLHFGGGGESSEQLWAINDFY